MRRRSPLLASLLAAVFTLAASNAFAAAVRWNNAAGGNWSVAANWSPAAIPTATDTAVIDLAGTYTVTVNQNLNIAGLRVNGAPSGTQTLTATSRTMTFTGPVTLGAQAVVTWTSCTVGGAGAITNQGSLTLSSVATTLTVAQALSNAGTLVVTGAANLNGALTTTTGSIFRVQGGTTIATATVANGFTNNGVIEITTSVPANQPSLAVTSGTLVNASGATIEFREDVAGGIYFLTATVDNRGTITVGHWASIAKTSADHLNSGTIRLTTGDLGIGLSGTTPTFTTTGTIDVTAGRRLGLGGTVAGGAGQYFYYSGGTLGGAGTVDVNLATLTLNLPLNTASTPLEIGSGAIAGPSTLTVQAGTTLSVKDGNLNGPTVVEPGATVQFGGACAVNGALTTSSGSRLRVTDASNGATTLTFPSGFTNNGAIEMTSARGAYDMTLALTAGTLVNASGATIDVLPGTGGARTLTAALDNRGTITVAQSLSIAKSGADHLSSGVIALTTGDLLVSLSGTTPTFTSTGAVSVPATRTLTLQGTVTGGAGQFFSFNGGTMGGAGTIRVVKATLNLGVGLASASLSTDNAAVAGPGALTLQTGTHTFHASTIGAATAIQPGTTLECSGATALNGALTTAAGATLRVIGTTAAATLTVASGFTNLGTIELTSTGAFAATLDVTTGTLINATGATIQSLPGGGGARTLAAALDNRGTLDVAQALTINELPAAHVNPGAIHLTTGDLTVVLANGNASFATTGVIDVPAGRKLTIDGYYANSLGAFHYAGGTMGGAGTIVVTDAWLDLDVPLGTAMAHLSGTGCTIAGPSTFTVQSGWTSTFSNSDLHAPVVVEAGGVLECSYASTLNGAFTMAPGATLRIASSNSSAYDELTVASGFTNHGTIELTSSTAAYAASLVVTTGTLINAADGVIRALPGTGGSRTLTAMLDNRGTIDVPYALTLNGAASGIVNSGAIRLTGGNLRVEPSPTFTTTGAIEIAANDTLAIASGHADYNGGSLGGPGVINLLSTSTLNLNAGIGTANTNLTGSNGTIAGPATLTVQAGTTMSWINGHLNAPAVIEAGGTLEWSGTTCSLESALTAGPGSLMRVVGLVVGAGVRNGYLDLPPGFTNRGMIELRAEVGTATKLTMASGTLVNAAGASIVAPSEAGGTCSITTAIDNRGTITAAGGTMSINLAGADHVNSGLIELTTGDLTVALGSTAGSLTTTGAIAVAADRTLTLSGGPIHYNGGTLGGAGTIVVSNATLNLNLPLGTATARLQGSSATFAGPEVLTIESGTTMPLLTSKLTGPTVLEGGARIDWTGTGSVTGAFTSSPGSLMHLMGVSWNPVVLTVPSGFTNHGTIELDGGLYEDATLQAAGTLVNAADGTIRTLATQVGDRNLSVVLDNRGTLDLRQTTLLSRSGAAHANTGVIDVVTGKTLTIGGASFTNQPGGALTGTGTIAISTGTAFAQSGIVRPGHSCGTLHIEGGYPASPTASYEVEIGGETAGSNDLLTVRDPVVLDGSLDISVVNGYQPRPGFRYQIATFPSRTGTFPRLNGLIYAAGCMWKVDYTNTDVGLYAMDQTWVHVISEGGPPAARDGHVAVYDSTGDRMMVFGGRTSGGVQNDVWVLTRASRLNFPVPVWTQLAPSGTPPAPRTHASAAYDPATNRMILFGGDDGATTPAVMGDTWVLTNANGTGGAPEWIALAPPSQPPSRTGAGAAYDRSTNRLILFGGNVAPSGCGGALADAWVLENANGLGGAPAWTALTPAGAGPTPRFHHGAAFDDPTGRLIVTGGDDGCGVPNTESWFLDGANGLGGPPTWTMVSPAVLAPAGWSLAGYGFDTEYHWMDAFGGVLAGAYVDTAYTLTGADGIAAAGWYRRLSYSIRPTPRAYHSMVVNSRSHTAVVFGGMSAGGRLDDTWRHEQAYGRVVDVEPPGEPPPSPVTRTGFARLPSPNPASGDVVMAVDVARDQRVDLDVFDIAGRRVATLHAGPLTAGRHSFRWAERGPSPGVYLVRLSTKEGDRTVRVVRLN